MEIAKDLAIAVEDLVVTDSIAEDIIMIEEIIKEEAEEETEEEVEEEEAFRMVNLIETITIISKIITIFNSHLLIRLLPHLPIRVLSLLPKQRELMLLMSLLSLTLDQRTKNQKKNR